jgi:cytochrome b561
MTTKMTDQRPTTGVTMTALTTHMFRYMPTLGRTVAVAAMVLAFPIAALATDWTVVPAQSRIGFSGTHAGKAFKGEFQQWTAEITFDPSDLAKAKATVTVQLASARTGDTTYDKTLPTVDWFDVAKTPAGVFTATGFRALGGDKFEADGTVTIRGFKVPVSLAFTWRPDGDRAMLTGSTKMKRLDFGIGKSSDAPGEWVSLDIPVDVTVALQKR